MDAAEANDLEGAQLCWFSKRRHDKDSPQQLGQPSPGSRSLLFDVFSEPVDDNSGTAGKFDIPSSAKVFDLELVERVQHTPRALQPSLELAPTDDVKTADHPTVQDDPDLTTKQYQDDLSTPCSDRPRTLWADVADDEVSPEPYFSEAFSDVATAEAVSQASQYLPGLSGFYQHAREVLPDVYQNSDLSETFSDVAAVSEEEGDEVTRVEATTGASCTATPLPLRGSGSPGTSPGGGMEDSCTTEDRLGTSSLGGRLKVSTTLGGPSSFPPHRQPAPVAPCFGAVSTCLAPAVAAFEGEAALAATSGQGTQCGPLPLDLMTRTSQPQSPLTHVVQATGVGEDVDHDFFPDFDGFTIFDLDGDGRFMVHDSHDQGSGTQCGPLPRHLLGSQPLERLPQTQSLSMDFGSQDHDIGTQCGPLPQHLLGSPPHEQFPQTQSPSMAESTRQTPQVQPTSLTTLMALEQRYLSLGDGPLKDAFGAFIGPHRRYVLDLNARMLELGIAPATLGDDFNAWCRSRDGISDLNVHTEFDMTSAQYAPQEQDTARTLPTPRTQCGPLPQLGSSPIQAPNGMTSAQYAPQELESVRTLPTPQTQCGPLPQLGPSPIQAITDSTSAQYAPQELASARTLPIPRTQCGPLPQQPMQAALTGPPAAVNKEIRLRKRKDKGKGKGKGMPPGSH